MEETMWGTTIFLSLHWRLLVGFPMPRFHSYPPFAPSEQKPADLDMTVLQRVGLAVPTGGHAAVNARGKPLGLKDLHNCAGWQDSCPMHHSKRGEHHAWQNSRCRRPLHQS
jgi:cytochrome b561